MDYTPYQVEVLATLNLIGACVQFALIIFSALLAVLTVKALW